MAMIRTLGLFFLLLYFSCTSNPFWDDKETKQLYISGVAIGENNTTVTSVQVWAETLDYLTNTDLNGNFIIPVENTQSFVGNLSGSVNLYFFINNYKLDSATIFFTDGLFAKSQTDFNNEGELLAPMELRKLFSGTTTLQFSEENINIIDTLKVIVEFEFHEPVTLGTYVYQKSGEDDEVHSGLIFNPTSGNQPPVFHRYTGTDDYGNQQPDKFTYFEYNSNHEITWEYLILPGQLDLPVGTYTVHPYILVYHDDLPEQFVQAMGGDSIFTFSRHYLNLPMGFGTDTLEIEND